MSRSLPLVILLLFQLFISPTFSQTISTRNVTCSNNGVCKNLATLTYYTCKNNGDCYCGNTDYCLCSGNNGNCYCQNAKNCYCNGNNGNCIGISSVIYNSSVVCGVPRTCNCGLASNCDCGPYSFTSCCATSTAKIQKSSNMRITIDDVSGCTKDYYSAPIPSVSSSSGSGSYSGIIVGVSLGAVFCIVGIVECHRRRNRNAAARYPTQMPFSAHVPMSYNPGNGNDQVNRYTPTPELQYPYPMPQAVPQYQNQVLNEAPPAYGEYVERTANKSTNEY